MHKEIFIDYFTIFEQVNSYLKKSLTIMRWLFLVLIKKPKVLFLNGSQNLFYQLYLRFKHNKSVSMWLDSFLDNYLLAQK